jgi:hypothetical protein
MRTWHFYDENTGVFTRDSLGGQDFKGIEKWVETCTLKKKGCKATETTGKSILGKMVDITTGEITNRSVL